MVPGSIEGVGPRGDLAVLKSAWVGPCGEVLVMASAGGSGPRGREARDDALCGLQFLAGDIPTTVKPALEQKQQNNELPGYLLF